MVENKSQPLMVPNREALPKEYEVLCRKITEVFVSARRRIEAERVRTYWETGRLIAQYRQADRGRHYDKGFIPQLARDLGMDISVLKRTVRFYEQFHKGAVWPQLTWSHYRSLMTINDPKVRSQLVELANAKRWTHYQLDVEIKKIKAKKAQGQNPLDPPRLLLNVPTRGPFYHYRIVEERPFQKVEAKLYVDLGFGAHLPVTTFSLASLIKGDIVQSHHRSKRHYSIDKITGMSEEQLFTYRSEVLRVIDGDTLWMHIDIGFGILKKVKIRLKGINAPALETSPGKRAKAYLENVIQSSREFTLKSTRAGKYDRYLGDLFNQNNEYINQLMLDSGHAERY